MDRYVRDVDRQIGDYSALKQIKDGMAARQYSRQQLGQLTKYLNQYNSQQFYVKAPIQKPTMPFPPLPAMVTPPQPYMRGAAPADTRFLDNATTAFGALNTGFETNKMIMNMAAGQGSASNPLLRLNSLLAAQEVGLMRPPEQLPDNQIVPVARPVDAFVSPKDYQAPAGRAIATADVKVAQQVGTKALAAIRATTRPNSGVVVIQVQPSHHWCAADRRRDAGRQDHGRQPQGSCRGRAAC